MRLGLTRHGDGIAYNARPIPAADRMTVITRFPPSPTGYLHLGGARTALYNWLYARQTGGTFILRIEDTDRERSTPEAVQAILDGMDWLGLDYDEGPIFQTARFDRYAAVVQQLLADGHAYACDCSPERLTVLREAQMQSGQKPRYDGHCRERGLEPGPGRVVRFRNPHEGAVQWEDLVKGPIAVANDELDDLIIARSDGTPTYNLCVVVDDLDMGMTHILRGDDHVNNTPRQLNILRALGGVEPRYGHIPMILGPDGKRLSKRHGAVSVMLYREMGYTPQALRNYLARLGWSHGDQELFSDDELKAHFSFGNIQRSPARFDPDKLGWVNQQWLQQTPAAELTAELGFHAERAGYVWQAGPLADAALSLLAPRCKTLVELVGDAAFLFAAPQEWDAKDSAKHVNDATAGILAAFADALERAASWDGDTLQQVAKDTVAACDVGFGKLGMPARLALAGRAQAPALDGILLALGREESLRRLRQFVATVESRPAAG